MPDSATHCRLTESALALIPFETGDNAGLIRDYCNYPDLYLSEPEKLAPYTFFRDGIQFHYLPDTPCNELYRYWSADPEHGIHRSRPFINENFLHACAGFGHYISETVRRFRHGDREEGKKYLGVLLHVLEDSAFGLHALEGPGGTDVFALNRLMESPLLPLEFLTEILCPDLEPPPYVARSLGNSVDEAVMRLYAAYCRAAGDSRKCCFSFVMNCLRNQREGNPPLIRRMFDNAVCLCADVIATVYLLAAGTETPPRSCLLSDLEPYRFPVGGFGAYRFRFWETDRAYGSDGAALPLKLEGEHGECVFSHGLSFGTHYHGDLCYRIASGVFRSFACTVGLHPASPAQGWISLDIINRGAVAESFQIGPERRSRAVCVNAPSGDFGFRFRSLPGNGIVVVGDPVFLPEKA